MVKHWNRKHNQRAQKKLLGQDSTVISEYPEYPPPIEPTMTTSAPQSGYFAYFALPGEVRNQIMDLVLKPGNIHFPQPSRKNTQAPPGVHFLASNRQVYTEGRGIFYSENTFHLPPGPITYTRQVFNPWQPQHLALIRRVTLHIGLHDLGHIDGFKQFDNKRQDTYGPLGFWSLYEVDYWLMRIWKSKIIFVRKHFPNLEEFRIVFWDIDYDVYTGYEHNKGHSVQPSHAIRGNEAATTGANGEAASKRAVTIVYKGEDIKATLRNFHMNGEVTKKMAHSQLHSTLVNATIQLRIQLRGYNSWEAVKAKLAEMTAAHELRIRR